MAIKPPFTDVFIPTADRGFYEGHSIPIALISKMVMVVIVLWALIWPLAAGAQLSSLKWSLLNTFNTFYILAVGSFTFFLIAIAIIPQTGSRVLGAEGEKPEFSTFSWFAMMFGAGLGVGLMVFATAEPLGLWGSNPEVIVGHVNGNAPEGVEAAYRYTFLHYGFHPWAIYVVAGLSLCYYAYTRDMPLTIRTALTPLFGRAINGPLGHLVDVIGVVATILGVAVTIGFGVRQLVSGMYTITEMTWLMDVSSGAPKPTAVGLITGLVLIMGLSILSAVSGVGRGIKWLSNANLVMSLTLILIFIVFGSFLFAMTTYGLALVDYVESFAFLSFWAYGGQSLDAFSIAPAVQAAGLSDADLLAVYKAATDPQVSLEAFRSALPPHLAALSPDVTSALYQAGTEGRLFNWQARNTTFYWAWWIAFAPFVGLFLARISKGRTIREFVVGAVFAPALVCFAWMTILGGTAIDLEMSGAADGQIIDASNAAKLFVTLGYMIDGPLLSVVAAMCVVLILTFLVTSADSGILVMNTIMSGGEAESGIRHRIVWGIILTAVVAVLLLAGSGGMTALSDAMIIGALPFGIIMVLMCAALAKALVNDHRRAKHGVTD